MFRIKHFCSFLIALLLLSVFIGIVYHSANWFVSGENQNLATNNIGNSGNYTNVLLLGWDGVQRNHLFELLNRGLMPNLSGFVQTGKLVNVTVSDHHTDTKAGWTQILTGYRWWKTGVFGNSYWFQSIPKGYTIPERLENIYGSNQIATAFITGKLNQMEIEDLTGTAAVGSPFATYSNQALYANLPSQLDVVSVGDLAEDRNADVVGPMDLQFIQNNTSNRFFGFFHFSDPDHIGHQYGENSIQYENAIETCDYWLGQILNTLNNTGILQKTLIYITADHGFDEGLKTHSNAPYIFFATNDNGVMRNGDEVDVAPTIYYGLGLWNQSFNPALDGTPLQLNLTSTEEQQRQAMLLDTDVIPTPSVSIADNGSSIKTVTFNATDNNLVVVNLIVDHVLKANGPWIWNYGAMVTASGSYNIDTSKMASGLHTVEIQAYDAHGSNNGGPTNDPANGGIPSSNTVDFNIGTTSTTTPNPTLPPTHSPIITQSPVPQNSGPTLTPTPTQTPSSTVTQSEPSQKQNSPVPSINSTFIIYATLSIITLVVLLLVISLLVKNKRKKN